MMATNQGDFRKEADIKIERACDHKLLRGGSEDLQYARLLLAEVRRGIPLPEGQVWKEKVDYREAHICMRMAGLENSIGRSDNARKLYQEAFRLFSLVENSNVYGTLAQIYSIAAGKNCGCELDVKKVLVKICNKTIQSDELELNTNLFNLLELSAYFTGIWDFEMNGIHFIEKRGYTIFSCPDEDNRFKGISFSSDFSKAELENLVKLKKVELGIFLGKRNVEVYHREKKLQMNRAEAFACLAKLDKVSEVNWYMSHRIFSKEIPSDLHGQYSQTMRDDNWKRLRAWGEKFFPEMLDTVTRGRIPTTFLKPEFKYAVAAPSFFKFERADRELIF